MLGVNYLVFGKEQQASVHGGLDGLDEVWEGGAGLRGNAGVACALKVVSVRLFLPPVSTNQKLEVSHQRPPCGCVSNTGNCWLNNGTRNDRLGGCH